MVLYQRRPKINNGRDRGQPPPQTTSELFDGAVNISTQWGALTP